MSTDKTLNDVYTDRNVLSTAFLRSSAELGYRTGYYLDPDSESDDWAVVYAILPEGHVSWHVRDTDVPDWVTYTPEEALGYADDPYTVDEKNDRLREYAQADYRRASQL